ncbi:MAG: hypothetical protein R2712_15345 [Vicinamibacterales bacterium]
MHQRQYRPGDVLDDYCPRERRVTDHAIVAMVGDEIQRTRCVVCEAEHEFKNARVPAPRRKSGTAALFTQVLDSLDAPARVAPPAPADPAADPLASDVPDPVPASADPIDAPDLAAAPETTEDRPFRRSLIRAQLPRPEGQPPPTRAIPEFTMHQPLNQRGKRPGAQGRFRRRPGQGGGGGDHAAPVRFNREPGQGGSGNGNQGGRRRRRKKSQH